MDNFSPPEGYSYEEVIQTITDVCEALCESYQFGYYDKEDIFQEAFIMGLKGLSGYDSTKSALKTFMYTHINNRLRTFKRDKYIRNNYVCPVCNLEDDDCTYCISRAKHQRSKIGLMYPVDIHNVSPERECSLQQEDYVSGSVSEKELVDKIDRELPISMRTDYLKMRDGVYVPKTKREEIINVIREIISL